MPDWMMTATTIYCEAVDDEVTLIVNGDGTARCTAYNKYGRPSRETARLVRARGKRLGRQLACVGPECARLLQYRDRLLAESGEKGAKAGGE